MAFRRQSVGATRTLSLITAVTICASSSPLSAEPVRVLTWNVESGGSDEAVIASKITALQAERGPYDLIGLTEVPEASAAA